MASEAQGRAADMNDLRRLLGIAVDLQMQIAECGQAILEALDESPPTPGATPLLQ